jgi:hypothetical protein
MEAPARWAGPLAASLWLGMFGLSLAELWMIAVTMDRPTPDQWGIRGFEAVVALSFGSVGATIAARRPDNRIGWLMLGFSLIGGAMAIVDQYPVLSEAAVAPLPFASVARWISAWIWVIGAVGLGSLLPLLFPDGRLPSARWRPAMVLALVAMATLIGSIMLVIEPIGTLPPSPVVALVSEEMTPLMAAGFFLYVVAAMTAAVSLFLRYRRASGEQQQQIKWVAYAAVLFTLGGVAGLTPLLAGQVFMLATVAFAAAAVAIAILRYKLYEIDLIINRTLVYGGLSAILAGVYTASITLSQRLFMAITGERSDAAIVLTTLIVAATFTPLKGRLQTIVDHKIKPAATLPPAALATRSSFETLEALARLIEINASGGLTPEEFRSAKAELLRRV